ncbi:MAG: hypothetical protein WD875_12455 [Pirellulales bacterium]
MLDDVGFGRLQLDLLRHVRANHHSLAAEVAARAFFRWQWMVFAPHRQKVGHHELAACPTRRFLWCRLVRRLGV